MTGNDWDKSLLALVAWREDRSGGRDGMLAVMFCVRNRVLHSGKTYAETICQPWQFSSMTATGDPQATHFPLVTDPQWTNAMAMVDDVIAGNFTDTTGGAVNYYAITMLTPPKWASQMTETVTIGNQKYFKLKES